MICFGSGTDSVIWTHSLPSSLYSVILFRNPSRYVPTGSFICCAGVGQSIFAVLAGGLISGVFGSSGASGGLTFGVFAGSVNIIWSGSN